MLVSTADLLSQIRQRTGVVVATVDDPALLTIVNAGIASAWDILVKSNPFRFLDSETIDLVSGTYEYLLGATVYIGEDVPAVTVYSYYKSLGFDVLASDANYYPLEQLNKFDDREFVETTSSCHDLQYLLTQTQVLLSPVPGYTRTAGLKHWFINEAPIMATTAYLSVVSSITWPNDWIEYVRKYASLELADFLGEEVRTKAAALAAHAKRLQESARPSDIVHPKRMSVAGASGRRRRRHRTT